jgi:hypothetical protein
MRKQFAQLAATDRTHGKKFEGVGEVRAERIER